MKSIRLISLIFLAVICVNDGPIFAQDRLSKPADSPAADAASLPGGYRQLPEAMKSEIIFTGRVTAISQIGSFKEAGSLAYHGTEVRVLQVLKGSIDNPAALEIHVLSVSLPNFPREEPPKKDGVYLFFVNVDEEVWNEVTKIMPATDDNIAQVKRLLQKPDAPQAADFYCGDDLPEQVALVKSDAIFTGEITSFGEEDHGDSFSYAHAGKRMGGVEVKVGEVLRGKAGDKTSVILFVNDAPGKPPNPARGPYVFYVKSNGETKGDPFTVLKMLPATHANIAATSRLINPPGEYINRNYLNLKKAALESDAVFIGAITELGTGEGSYVKVFHVLRGSPKRVVSVWLDINPAPREGSSYIFVARYFPPNEGLDGDLNNLQLLSASDENIARVKELIARARQ